VLRWLIKVLVSERTDLLKLCALRKSFRAEKREKENSRGKRFHESAGSFPTREEKGANSAELYRNRPQSITNVTGVFVRVPEVLRATATANNRVTNYQIGLAMALLSVPRCCCILFAKCLGRSGISEGPLDQHGR
jgi:hypothetical protein